MNFRHLRRDAVAEKDGIRSAPAVGRFDCRGDIIERSASAAVLRKDKGDIGNAVAVQVTRRLIAEKRRHKF